MNTINQKEMAPLDYAYEKSHIKILDMLYSYDAKIKETHLNILDKEKKAPIHYACIAKNLDIVRFLIEKGADRNIKDCFGKTPAHYICEQKTEENTEYILDLLFHKSNKFYLNVTDNEQRGLIHHSCISENQEAFDWLISKEVDLDVIDVFGKQPIHYACEKGNFQMTESLINHADQKNEIDGKRPIHYACEEGHIEIVHLLIKETLSLTATDKNNETALHRAMYRQHYKIVKLLLADKRVTSDILNIPDKYGLRLIDRACKNGLNDIVHLLIKKNVELNEPDQIQYKSVKSPICYACEEGHVAIVRMLIRSQVDLSGKDKRTGKTILHRAVERGHDEIVKLLVNQDVDLNAVDNLGKMPIHGACRKGHLQILHLLLRKRAQLNAADMHGKTPVHCALDYKGDTIQRKAQLNAADMHGKTPVNSAVKDDNIQRKYNILKLLIDYGVDLNAQKKKGRKTVLHQLCEKHRRKSRSSRSTRPKKNEHFDAVKMLMGKVDVNIPDEKNRTPVHRACCWGKYNYEIVQILISNGANLDQMDIYGQIPLHRVCGFDQYEMAELLVGEMVKKGMPLNIEDNWDRTPLTFASKWRHENIKRLLEKNAKLQPDPSSDVEAIVRSMELDNF